MARLRNAATALVVTLVALSGAAARGQSADELESRMEEIQAELDATTARIENLRTQEDELRQRVGQTQARIELLEQRKRRMMGRVVEAARELYMTGTLSTLEVLIASKNLGDLADHVELLSHVSERDRALFVQFGRTQQELGALKRTLGRAARELDATRTRLAREARRLQDQFAATKDRYEELMAAMRRKQRVSSPAVSAPAPAVRPRAGMACPVAGPVSFTDTWGAPRSGGRTHQGVDMMASYGTPVVAIVSGAITFSGYGSSAGNWQILSGDDGHQYWYMHNQSNIVSGGRVSVGQQIATVGDTGNATGIPHLHFEYHPGGGSAVNPTPLVASVC